MSNIVDKVKDKVENILHKDNHHSTTSTSTTHTGPHNSGVANAADPRVDSDRDGSRNAGVAAHGPGGHHTGNHHTGVTGTQHTGNHHTGNHHTGVGSGVAAGTTSTSTNHGPHDSNLANKLDPRVDSDRDGSSNLGAAKYGPGAHSTGVTSGNGLSNATGYGSGSTNHGPHDSNLANKADPRVDSDRDGSRNAGAAAYGPGAHQTSSGFGNTGIGSGSNNYGPHDSNLANKVDPRVDSDRDGSRNAGAAAYGPGAHQTSSGFGNTGIGSGSNNYGPHDSNLANKVDPRVDSDRDGSRNAGAASYGPGSHHTGGAVGSTGHQGHQGGIMGSGPGTLGSSGPGPADNTAGPHKSNLANKIDPRVDSDLDGSRTVGGNNTTNTNTTF